MKLYIELLLNQTTVLLRITVVVMTRVFYLFRGTNQGTSRVFIIRTVADFSKLMTSNIVFTVVSNLQYVTKIIVQFIIITSLGVFMMLILFRIFLAIIIFKM